MPGTLPESVAVSDAGQAGAGEGTGVLAVLRVRMRFVDGGVELYWNSAPGTSYQVQMSNDFKNWLDYGPPRVAEGEREAVRISLKEEMACFRVVELP